MIEAIINILNLTKKKLVIIALIIITLIAAFNVYRINKLYQLKYVTMDVALKEVSGIEFDKNQRLWAINDGGNGPFLHHVQRDGSIKRSIRISNAKNLDWEDMAQNTFGHFFIGDFGNNESKRNWLTIYKIENPIDIKTESTQAEIIKFAYPEYIFPNQKNKNHDLEAFVHYNNRLHLFTKNRTVPFDGKTHLFSIGEYAANHKAKYEDSFTTCTDFKMSCWITSAAISPDQTKLVLLDSNRLWLFKNWQLDNFFSGEVFLIDLGIITQKESVAFFDNNNIVFTDEEFKGIGRNAYIVNLNDVELERVR
jgi:hypothetical protein